MPKKKIVAGEDGLTTVAVAVGSALGKLAQKIGLGETAASPDAKSLKKAVVRKAAAPKKKAVTKKKVASQKAPGKRPSMNKVKSRAKRA